MDTYSNLLISINESHSNISYLKLDIEGSEFFVFEDLFLNSIDLLKNVEQIGIEVHIGLIEGE